MKKFIFGALLLWSLSPAAFAQGRIGINGWGIAKVEGHNAFQIYSVEAARPGVNVFCQTGSSGCYHGRGQRSSGHGQFVDEKYVVEGARVTSKSLVYISTYLANNKVTVCTSRAKGFPGNWNPAGQVEFGLPNCR